MINRHIFPTKKSCNSSDECSHSSCGGLCCTRIENLSVKVPELQILEDINIHIHCGQFTSIIGPNGAGKSTLLKAILGEIKYSGNLKFCSEDNKHMITPKIGYVPQKLAIDKDSPCSVLDIFLACSSGTPVCFIKPASKKKTVLDILDRVQAVHLANRRLSELSGGEIQRILLGLALVPIPNLLLLDEPVSGVDKNGAELFYKIVSEVRKKYDLSIIMVSHDLEKVRRYADKVVLLNRTILCQGTPKEVFDSEAFKNAFTFTRIYSKDGGDIDV